MIDEITMKTYEKTKYKNEPKTKKTNKSKKNKSTKEVLLPWCGVIEPHKCKAIRVNHGLYTQCQNVSDELCGTCLKQKLKNTNREPDHGYIEERLTKGDEFKNKNGQKPELYNKVMEKLNITMEEASECAKNRGMIIPKEETVERKKRGRPKKSKKCVETYDTSGSENDEEDTLDNENEEEDEEVEVKELTHNDKVYYINPLNNALYDSKTYELLGEWDEKNKTIIDIEQEIEE